MHAFTHSYIHTCLSFVYMYSFICFVVFYLSLLFLTHMHFYHVSLACSIYSFRYVYHIFISYNLIFKSCHLLVTSYILLTYIFMYYIRLSYLMTYTYTFLYLYVLLVLYQAVLSLVKVIELIPIRRYLYTYLYFYLSYTCIYLILCMIYYDYHICLLFFLIYGPNMSSTFIILCMAVFLTQWSFHRVQEHPNWSSDKGDMTFRSWRPYVVKS